MVRLKTYFAAERGLDLALVSASAGEERAAELHLDEDLRVERAEGRVEGRSGDRGVDVVGRGGRVAVVQSERRTFRQAVLGVSSRGEECDDLLRAEAGVAETVEDLVNCVERLGDEQVGGRSGGLRPTKEKFETGCTRTVRESDRTGQLDARVDNSNACEQTS